MQRGEREREKKGGCEKSILSYNSYSGAVRLTGLKQVQILNEAEDGERLKGSANTVRASDASITVFSKLIQVHEFLHSSIMMPIPIPT